MGFDLNIRQTTNPFLRLLQPAVSLQDVPMCLQSYLSAAPAGSIGIGTLNSNVLQVLYTSSCNRKVSDAGRIPKLCVCD